jgi:predicted nucleic acid-binding protein
VKVLIDTNVILDVLLNRPLFFAHSRAVFELAEHGRISAYISSSAITDIFYFVRKTFKDKSIAYTALNKITSIFKIAPVDESTIKRALSLRWNDFEDAVQYVTAQESGLHSIITRNTVDYESTKIPCLTPAEFIRSGV